MLIIIGGQSIMNCIPGEAFAGLREWEERRVRSNQPKAVFASPPVKN
jgi:hypothetical protein